MSDTQAASRGNILPTKIQIRFLNKPLEGATFARVKFPKIVVQCAQAHALCFNNINLLGSIDKTSESQELVERGAQAGERCKTGCFRKLATFPTFRSTINQSHYNYNTSRHTSNGIYHFKFSLPFYMDVMFRNKVIELKKFTSFFVCTSSWKYPFSMHYYFRERNFFLVILPRAVLPHHTPLPKTVSIIKQRIL